MLLAIDFYIFSGWLLEVSLKGTLTCLPPGYLGKAGLESFIHESLKNYYTDCYNYCTDQPENKRIVFAEVVKGSICVLRTMFFFYEHVENNVLAYK